MGKQEETNSALAPFRVLDLTDEKGFLCGRMLGDLGADVIKIEKPGGDPSRNIGPFYHDIPDPEKSLFWFAFNNNKRGITLNIETRDGQEIFKRLAKAADVVIESFPPGYMDELGLGYAVLSEINPRIIMTSITPFGQSGPYKDYAVSDMVLWAMGGIMYIWGDSDRPPVQLSFPQAYLHGGGDAAVGTLIAHYYREITGEGQHVDVSILDTIPGLLMHMRLLWEFAGVNPERAGPYGKYIPGADQVGTMQRLVWPCKDGYVMFFISGGLLGAHTNSQLIAWMESEGMAPPSAKDKDWKELDMTEATQEELDLYHDYIIKFFMNYTKAELYEGALQRGIMFYPVSSAKETMENRQLVFRDFWETVTHPELNETITYPGASVKASETPCRIYRRAPLIGEHNEEIYEKELGFTKTEILTLKQGGII